MMPFPAYRWRPAWVLALGLCVAAILERVRQEAR